MNRTIHTVPLEPEAFAPFGDVIEVTSEPDQIINRGMCGRYHDLADLDFTGEGARAGISLFQAKTRSLPYELDMMERHPQGSQAFLPMTADAFLVTVAPDNGGEPGTPQAFLTRPGQGVNYRRGTWHGVLTPLHDPGLFAVVDRIGDGDNLEEHWFEVPYTIQEP